MIFLQFWDAVGEELKLVQLAHVEGFVEFAGKVHVTMASGAEHIIGCRRLDVENALAQIPTPAPSIVIIGL